MSILNSSQDLELQAKPFSVYEWKPGRYVLVTRNKQYRAFIDRISRDLGDLRPIKVSLFAVEDGRLKATQNYDINGLCLEYPELDLMMIDVSNFNDNNKK